MNAICKLVKAGQSAIGLILYLYAKSCEIFGRIDGAAVTGIAKIDGQLLAINHVGHASEVRHVILSAPSGKVGDDTEIKLKQAAEDWIKTYAADRSWICVMHKDKEHIHAHIAVENVKKKPWTSNRIRSSRCPK